MARELKITLWCDDYWADEDYDDLYLEIRDLVSKNVVNDDYYLEWIDV